jgi:pimeloyl-ACP methyl ester carboxylesterase
VGLTPVDKLYTQDKVEIAYDHINKGFDSVVIVCPGFFNSRKNRWMQKAVDMVSAAYDVVIFDFRGHGDSGGRFSWTAKEHLDLEAVLEYVRSRGYKNIGILAFSLGAAVSVNVASTRDDIKSMVLISCPSSFRKIDYHFWEPEMFSDLKDNIECDWEGKGARITHLFLPKKKPIKTITRIKDAAILFINGSRDWVIKGHHAKTLYDAAQTRKKLEIIEGGLHAERLIQQYPDKIRELVLGWFSETIKGGGVK